MPTYLCYGRPAAPRRGAAARSQAPHAREVGELGVVAVARVDLARVDGEVAGRQPALGEHEGVLELLVRARLHRRRRDDLAVAVDKRRRDRLDLAVLEDLLALL